MRVLFTIVFITIAALAGCDRSATAPAEPQADDSSPAAGPRIVSLSPAISRTLVDLELDHHIVGRTPFCDALDRAVPVVGDLLDLNYEALVRVRPTHVLVQPPASGINPRLERLAAERGWALHTWVLEGIADIGRLIGEAPMAVLTDNDDALTEALGRSSALLRGMGEIFRQDEPRERPIRTLLVVGVEPVTVYGRGTYLHEVLQALGDRNAVDLNGYPQLTLEDVTRLNPQAMILVNPGGSRDDFAAFGPLQRLSVDAVREQRLAVLTHRDALLPSSAVVGVAEELREILASFR